MLVVEVLVIAGLLLAVALVAAGRGDPLAAAPEDGPDRGLPDGSVASDDVPRVRFRTALRGYRMVDVDEVLDRLQQALAEHEEELRRLRAPAGATPDSRQGAADGEPFEPVPSPQPRPTHEPEPVVPGPEPVVPGPEPVPTPEPAPAPRPAHEPAPTHDLGPEPAHDLEPERGAHRAPGRAGQPTGPGVAPAQTPAETAVAAPQAPQPVRPGEHGGGLRRALRRLRGGGDRA